MEKEVIDITSEIAKSITTDVLSVLENVDILFNRMPPSIYIILLP